VIADGATDAVLLEIVKESRHPAAIKSARPWAKIPALLMADDLPIPVQRSASEEPRTDPCVKDWTCAHCGRRLLLRMRMRRPGGCGYCGALALAPSPSRPR